MDSPENTTRSSSLETSGADQKKEKTKVIQYSTRISEAAEASDPSQADQAFIRSNSLGRRSTDMIAYPTPIPPPA